MKNVPALILIALSLSLCLIACQSEAPAETTTETTTTPEDKPAKAEASGHDHSAPATVTTGYQSVGPEEFKELMEANDRYALMDVRTPAEVAEGKIDGAINLDFRSSHFAQTIKQLDQHRIYFVYCRSGGRSAAACEAMQEAGIPNVINLEGGYMAWEAAGY